MSARRCALALAVLLVAGPSRADEVLFVRWETHSRPMVAFDLHMTTIERFLGDLHRQDDYEDRTPAEVDSLDRVGDPEDSRLTRLTEGIQFQFRPSRKRHFLRHFVPGLPPAVDSPADAPEVAGTGMSGDSLHFVGIDSVAGLPARKYEYRGEDQGFMGMKMESMGRVDTIVEVWLAPRRGLLAEYEARRALVPQSVLDTLELNPVHGDTLIVPTPLRHAPTDRIAGFHPDSVSMVAMTLRYEFMGAEGDSMEAAAAHAESAAPGAAVQSLDGRRLWLVRRRLIELRRDSAAATRFELPAGSQPYD